MEKKMWLPLSGRLLARGGEAGDPGNPVTMPPLIEAYDHAFPKSLEGPIQISWLGVDWDAKQVLARVIGPQGFFDWIQVTYGTDAPGDQKQSRERCRSFLVQLGKTELEDRSFERLDLLRRKRSDDTIGLLEQEELLLLESV